MDLYEQNLELLKKLYPHVAKRLEEEEEDKWGLQVETLMGRRGMPTMRVRAPSGKDLTVHSMFDPMQEAREMLSKFDDDKDTSRYMVVGFGLGYVVEAALERNKNKSFVVLIEPSINVFKAAMRARDLTDLFKSRRVSLGVGSSKTFLMERMLEGCRYESRFNMNVVELSYPSQFPEYYQLVREVMSDWTQQVSLNQFTVFQLGEDFIFNMMSNYLYSYFNPGLPQVFGKFKDRPAFVVAPGPSLSKNIDLIPEAYDKALIIALDTSIKPLLKRGVKPHFVMSVDPKVENYIKYQDADIPGEVTLFGAMDTYPKIFSTFQGRIFTYFHNSMAQQVSSEFLGNKGVLGSGGSVACDAFFLAVAVGANPIVFLGLDLSFPDQKWYVDGSFRDEAAVGRPNAPSERECREFIWVDDIYGNKVATYPQYYTTLNWFNMQVPKINAQVIDATEGGAKIEGTEIMTLREVIDQYCQEKFDPVDTIFEIHDGYEPTEREKALEKIDALILNLDEIADYSVRGMELCDQFDHFVQERKVGKLKRISKRIERMNFQIMTKYKVIGILELALTKSFYRIEAFNENLYSEEAMNQKHKDIVELSRWLFRDVKRICGAVKLRFERIRKAVDEGIRPEDMPEEDLDKIEHDREEYIKYPTEILKEAEPGNGTVRKD